ncbi:glycosyltransferase family 2 protein [Staphylococcus xylosus]|uniref:glycosyltransferase family 2 protein n=1 Tax=Staphylococcus xylosus TaxID=1288 RepID=UPI003F9D46DB
MKKVTVIIPTFNNKEEILNRLINSLDNQTMDSNDFDVIFIDDGSSDFNAYKRLKEKTTNRSNFYSYRISPSGWSSRPRNKGIDLANSKYVFFSDDDDSIFPQALERLYNFAEENQLDVVNPKVVRTKGWSWGWKEYQGNKIDAQKDGVNSMGPMTVPKLYRKDFLTENNLYFSEGEKVWWEDVMYSCLVYSKNPRIGIYSDYPIYHWREQNASAGFGKDLEHKWRQLNNLAEFFIKHLNEKDCNTMLTHWYNSRVLGAIRKNFHTKKDETKNVEFRNAKAWKEKYVSKEIISNLDTRSQLLDKILEIGSLKLAISYSEIKADVTTRSYIKEISFDKDEILFTTEATITDDETSNVKIKGKPKAPKLNLPKDVKKAIPKDLTFYHNKDSEDNMYLPALKGRTTRTTWNLSENVKNSEFIFNTSLTGFEVTGKLTFGLKLDEFIQDDIDLHQPYDLATRFSYLDYFSQRAIACDEDFKYTAIINGNTYLIYKNASELISIDLNSTVKNFLDFAKLEMTDRINDGNYIKIPLKIDHIYGESKTELLASIYNDKFNGFVETTAYLTTYNGEAYLEIHNPEQLEDDSTIDVSIGNKAKRIKLTI